MLKTNCDAQAADDLDLAIEHRLGQPVFRQRVAQHAARLGVGFEDGDLVPEQRQVEGRGEPGRARRPPPRPCGRSAGAAGDDVRRRRLESVGQQDIVGDHAMHLAHVDRLVDGLTPAAVVARMLADPAGRGRQRIVHDHGQEGVVEPPLLVELEEARDVHVQRAAVLARRQDEVLADAGAAALGPDVVLELVVEMAQRGEERVRRGLPERAERRVADHPPELVEVGEILLAPLALGDAGEDAQRLVQPDPAGRALAAGFGAGELDEVAGDVDHAIVFVHHHHAARPHDGAELAERFVIDRGLEQVGRDAAARRPAGLHRLDRMAV